MAAVDPVRKLFHEAEAVDVAEADEVYPRGWFWPESRAGDGVTVTGHVKSTGRRERVLFLLAIGEEAVGVTGLGEPGELVQQYIEWSRQELRMLVKQSEEGKLTQEGGAATGMAGAILCGTSFEQDPLVAAAVLDFSNKVLGAIVAYVRNPVGAA
jgi:hypothetical protein